MRFGTDSFPTSQSDIVTELGLEYDPNFTGLDTARALGAASVFNIVQPQVISRMTPGEKDSYHAGADSYRQTVMSEGIRL